MVFVIVHGRRDTSLAALWTLSETNCCSAEMVADYSKLMAPGTQNFTVPLTSSPSDVFDRDTEFLQIRRSSTMDTLPHEQSDLEGGWLADVSETSGDCVELMTYGHSVDRAPGINRAVVFCYDCSTFFLALQYYRHYSCSWNFLD